VLKLNRLNFLSDFTNQTTTTVPQNLSDVVGLCVKGGTPLKL